MPTTTILDNGGSQIKLVKVSSEQHSDIKSNPALLTPLLAPNALARAAKNASQPPRDKLGKSRRPANFLVAREILLAPDTSGMTFRRPVDLGFVSNWDAQRDVWASVFSNDQGIGLATDDIENGSLIVTEHVGQPIISRRAMDHLVFENFQFARYAPVPPQRLSAVAVGKRNCLVVDSGFSFTTAVPIVSGIEVAHCAKRLKVGGKLLTNYLRETISYRSWNMTDETSVINAVKERLCYVSMSFMRELAARRKVAYPVKHYVLPDLSRSAFGPLGHVFSENEETDGTEQILKMNNECIAIPEVLFNPSDIGIKQAGAAEIIHQAVESCHEDVRADLYENIVLTGGNCLFPNFMARVELELRPLVDAMYDINITMEADPTLTAVKGGVCAAVDDSSEIKFVSREEFAETGTDGILRKLYGDDMDLN